MFGVPFNREMPAQFVISVTAAAYHCSQHGILTDINYSEGTLLSTQRNRISKQALDNGFDLLFVDNDMVFKPEDVQAVLDVGGNVVGGLYYAKRPPYKPLVFNQDLVEEKNCFGGLPQSAIPDGPFMAKGLATGFLYISNDALKKIWDHADTLGRPFNFWQMPNGDELGEDLSFCHRCNLLNIEMYCQPNVNLGHLGYHAVTRQTHLMEIQKDYHYCNDIEGWMTVQEQGWLYNMAKQMNLIAEIGSWKGKSTHALLSGCPGRVYAIDHFNGSTAEIEGPHKEATYGDVYKEFKRNVGKFSNLETIHMASADAAKVLNFNFDMVFIDGGHTCQEVKADIETWLPKTKKLICGHDYTWESVRKAVVECLGEVKICNSIWYKELG